MAREGGEAEGPECQDLKVSRNLKTVGVARERGKLPGSGAELTAWPGESI